VLNPVFAAKQITCPHILKDQIVVAHEIICNRCGTVIGIDNLQEVDSESTVNLFQEIQPGCKPVKLESCLRIHESKFTSSAFSNACDKLSLPRHVSLTA
jgi:transcription initiation factor TFIIIB Brf1 subunit/transcription initiation factor TFIIB